MITDLLGKSRVESSNVSAISSPFDVTPSPFQSVPENRGVGDFCSRVIRGRSRHNAVRVLPRQSDVNGQHPRLEYR